MDTEFDWDVAIVGAGMAGAALGYKLARAGHKVIFLEKGAGHFSDSEEEDPDTLDPAQRMAHGRWPVRLSGTVDGKPLSFFPPLGCGSGGSTLLYAATLERFFPTDFEASADGGVSWPISYDQLAPSYTEAERLLKVSTEAPCPGSNNLRTPGETPHISTCDRHFFLSLQSNGMHPYRLPLGFKATPECQQCGGMICRKACKMDARRAFIEPAMATGNAHFLDFCTVERIEATDSQVTSLVCRRNDSPVIIKASIYVLAAGALSTPVLMLNSIGPSWPHGVANSSGMIGRNLMFHATDFFAVWPKDRLAAPGPPQKTIGVRDFYRYRGIDLGCIQSTGLSANYRNILHFLKMTIDAHTFRPIRFLRPFLRIPAMVAGLLLGDATVFSTILMDRPYRDNRVIPDHEQPGGMRFEYTVRAELAERVKLLRSLCRQAFRGHRVMIMPSDANLNFGHSCGTCRFGDDPTNSVLDANNKTHDLGNLYVADASFFPTSGGTNPSLTIAANALRVAEHISKELGLRTYSSPSLAM